MLPWRPVVFPVQLLKSIAIKPFFVHIIKVSFLGKGRRDEQKDDYC